MKNLIQQTAITLLFLSVSVSLFANTGSDLENLRKKVTDQLLKPVVNDSQIKLLLETIRDDGTWPDIDYKDISNTGFQHAQHLNNLVELSRAFKKEGSRYNHDESVKKIIYLALNYWLANDFICENWWWNQIGTPNLLVSTVLLVDEDLTKEKIAKLLPIIGRANLNATGARPSGDRIKIAGIYAKTALFNRDSNAFDEAIKVIEGEIKFSTERGMQFDYSFHHREDWVNNTLSYGLGYAEAFAEWAAYVAGTNYKFSEKPLQQLVDYYLDGICKMMVFGKYPDPGAMNRDITRPGAQKAFGTETCEKLMAATDYRKNELTEICKIRRENTKATLSFSTFFWDSDHFTIQRPDYFTSVRMYSNRNCNMEQPYNGEGLMNHHRGDGTNYISRTGIEYFNMSPVFDWQKIPGTTVVQKPSLPSEKEIQKKGLTDFVGAVTDGVYGAVSFDFRSPHDPLEAKKSWFFFDKEYVCLGAGITSESKYPVTTTLNQCLLNGDVVVMKGNEKLKSTPGEKVVKNVSWVFHDGIGYLFPQPVDVNIFNNAASGSWYMVNHQSHSSKEVIKKDVFKLWIDHGKQPQKTKCQYMVVPAITVQEMDSQNMNQLVEILSNTIEIQAVKCVNLNVCQVVFYKAGEIQISDGLKIQSAYPGLVMIKTKGTEIEEISVADPTHNLKKMHLKISGIIEKCGENYKSVWNKLLNSSEISIDLPQSVYAGKSVTIHMQ